MIRGLLALYGLSGFAVLAAEVVWARVFHRHLGSGAFAVSLVLTGFLAGTALGALVAQPRLSRLRNPLRAYALVELAAGVGTAGLSFVALFAPDLFRPTGGEVVAVALIAVAAAPLGASFPLLAVIFRDDGARGRRLRHLYGVNALGGGAGGLAAGLLGVPIVGETAVAFLAAALHLVVAAGVFALARRTPAARPAAGSERSETAPEADATRAPAGSPVGRLAVYAALSGFCVFYWEVLWTRILVLTVGSSVYAFSTVASSVVLGIGVGSILCGGRLLARSGGWLLPLGASLLALATYFLVPHLAAAYLLGVRSLAWNPLVSGSVGAGLVVFLPNVLLGSLFPWIVSRRVALAGGLTAASCLGCVAGAFLGGPLTAGSWTLENTYRFGLAALLGLAGWGSSLVWRETSTPRRSPRVALVAALVLAAAAISGAVGVAARPGSAGLWDRGRLLSGVYQWTADSLENAPLDEVVASRELLVVVEGREVIVSVDADREVNTLYVRGNGKPEGSVPLDPERRSLADLPTQLLLGIVPALLIADRPHSPTLMIGLGSGMSLGALVRTRRATGATGRVDIVELEPAYLEALRHAEVARYFRPYLDEEEAAACRWLFGDARRVLARELRGRRYGAIVSQPSEPWIAGASPLFTVEFFREVASHLEPGGIFVQWVQLYKLDLESLRMLVRTFRRVFPRVFLLRPPRTGELILLGVEKNVEFSRLFAGSSLRHVDRAGIRGAVDWLALHVLGPAGVDRFVGEGRVNTDGRGELEFRGPRTLHLAADAARENLRALRALAADDPVSSYLPPDLRRPPFLRRLAERNLENGDVEEAEALIAGDASPEAERLRARLRERRKAGDGREAGS